MSSEELSAAPVGTSRRGDAAVHCRLQNWAGGVYCLEIYSFSVWCVMQLGFEA